MLGADPDATYSEASVRLQLGDVLLLFTDGLIERRGIPLDDSLAELAKLASRPVPDIGAFADDILTNSVSDTADDACLLVVTIR